MELERPALVSSKNKSTAEETFINVVFTQKETHCTQVKGGEAKNEIADIIREQNSTGQIEYVEEGVARGAPGCFEPGCVRSPFILVTLHSHKIKRDSRNPFAISVHSMGRRTKKRAPERGYIEAERETEYKKKAGGEKLRQKATWENRKIKKGLKCASAP